jgi:Zn-dependent protease
LNPLRHVDPFGSVVLPLLLLLAGGVMFGWAKPVPVNFARLRNPRWGMVLVAAAGPGMNMTLAIIAVLFAVYGLPHMPDSLQGWLFFNLDNAIYFNLLLAVFNMIPVPPLDGGRVLVGILPRPLAWRVARLEKAGIILMLLALFVAPILGAKLGLDLDIFRWLVGGPVDAIGHWMVGLFR